MGTACALQCCQPSHTSDRSRIPTRLSRSFRENLYDLYDLAHVTGLELYDLHDPANVSGVGLYSTYTHPAQHLITEDTRSIAIYDMYGVDDLDDDLAGDVNHYLEAGPSR